MPFNCWEFTKCGASLAGSGLKNWVFVLRRRKRNVTAQIAGPTVDGCAGWYRARFAVERCKGATPKKLSSCSECAFYKQVHEEEGSACESESEVLLSLGDPSEIVHAYEELRTMHARLKEAQAQLLQARKLEAIGQLASGIAHEINTPTQFIGDNLTFLKEAFGSLLAASQASSQILNAVKAAVELLPPVNPPDAEQLSLLVDEIPKAIEQSLEGVQRVASIVRALKEFAHPGHNERLPTDIHRAIENTIAVARGEWKNVAEVRTDFDRGLPQVPCIADEFSQVILNLLVNACHAIRSAGDGSTKSGLILIETRRDGDWAEIRICDNGPGIPKAIQHRIFEPFFTTKEVGKGTGQGLYLAHLVVVKKHEGTLRFECPPGQGTTFIVRLPLQEAPDRESGVASPQV